jgi:hypothetical protein
MNNKIKFCMVAFVAMISIFSCKKEIDYSDPNSNGCQLTSWKVISGTGEFTQNLQYDAIGRVIKESTTLGGTYIRVFTANKITVTDEEGIVDELILSNGRAISSGTGGTLVAGVPRFENTKRYDYNTDSYLTAVKSYQNDMLITTNILTYADGNLIKSVVTDAVTGQITNTTTFSYSSEKAVNISLASDPLVTIADSQIGNYFGKPSKNALGSTTETSIDSGGNGHVSNSTYSYQLDAKGNATVININITNTPYNGGVAGLSGNAIDKYEQTFSCK